jgi:hypothetical protein
LVDDATKISVFFNNYRYNRRICINVVGAKYNYLTMEIEYNTEKCKTLNNITAVYNVRGGKRIRRLYCREEKIYFLKFVYLYFARLN